MHFWTWKMAQLTLVETTDTAQEGTLNASSSTAIMITSLLPPESSWPTSPTPQKWTVGSSSPTPNPQADTFLWRLKPLEEPKPLLTYMATHSWENGSLLTSSKQSPHPPTTPTPTTEVPDCQVNLHGVTIPFIMCFQEINKLAWEGCQWCKSFSQIVAAATQTRKSVKQYWGLPTTTMIYSNTLTWQEEEFTSMLTLWGHGLPRPTII